MLSCGLLKIFEVGGPLPLLVEIILQIRREKNIHLSTENELFSFFASY